MSIDPSAAPHPHSIGWPDEESGLSLIKPRSHVYSAKRARTTLSDRSIALPPGDHATAGRADTVALLAAAVAAVLHRYSGQGSIPVGIPLQTGDEVLEACPAVIEVSGDEGFGALLARAEAGCAEARRGPPATFRERVRARGREGMSNRNPLFALAVEDVADVRHPEPRADVILRVGRGEVLTVAVDYSARLFDAAAVGRFVGHVLRLAADGLARPTVPIALLGMLDARERAWIEAAGRGPERAIPRCGVHDLVLEQAARTPAAPAIVDHATTCTYAELEQLSARLSAALAARGVGPDARVGLLVAAGAPQIAALLAILRTGAAVAPLDPTWPPARLRWAISDAGLALVVADAAHQRGVPDGISTLDVADTASPSPEVFPAVQPDDPLYLLYTSGSTGVPKAVVVPHRTLLNLIAWQRERAADPGPRRTLQRTSLAFDVGFQEVFSTLAGGGCLVVADEDERADVSRLPGLLAGHEIQRLFLPPVALAQLAHLATGTALDLGRLREIIVAGDQLRITTPMARLFRQFPDCTLDNQYGPTETHVVAAHLLEGASTSWPELPPIGRPVSNCRLRIIDAHGQLVPVGIVGEIVVEGAPVALGYHGRDEETLRAFVETPGGGGRAYRTGDRGRLREDGAIEFVGRADRQVKIRGYRVELGEVEAALAQMLGVREAAVIVEDDPAGDRRLVACVVTQDRGVDAAALRAGLQERLPPHMVPASADILVSDELPVTATGKLDRAALRNRSRTASARTEPLGDLETRIAAVWARVLDLAAIGPHDDYAAIGGHSLAAIQIASELHDLYGVTIPLRLLLDGGTVARVAERVRTARSRGSGSTESAAPPDTRDAGGLQDMTLPDGEVIATPFAPETAYLYTDVCVHRSYEGAGIRFPADGTYVDVGANVGLFARHVLERAPASRVIAFEPAPVLVAALRRNLRAFGARATVIEAAASDKAGMAAFTYYPKLSGMSSLHADPTRDAGLLRCIVANTAGEVPDGDGWLNERIERRFLQVETTTLEQALIARGITRIDLLKIDVQRAERAALRGVGRLWPAVRQAVVEVHDEDGALADVQRFLGALGFRVKVAQIAALHRGTPVHFAYAVRP